MSYSKVDGGPENFIEDFRWYSSSDLDLCDQIESGLEPLDKEVQNPVSMSGFSFLPGSFVQDRLEACAAFNEMLITFEGNVADSGKKPQIKVTYLLGDESCVNRGGDLREFASFSLDNLKLELDKMQMSSDVEAYVADNSNPHIFCKTEKVLLPYKVQLIDKVSYLAPYWQILQIELIGDSEPNQIYDHSDLSSWPSFEL